MTTALTFVLWVLEGEENEGKTEKVLQEMMVESQIGQKTLFTDSRRLATVIRINPNESTPRHCLVKLLKTKDIKSLESSKREMTLYLYGKNNLNYREFSIRDYEG